MSKVGVVLLVLFLSSAPGIAAGATLTCPASVPTKMYSDPAPSGWTAVVISQSMHFHQAVILNTSTLTCLYNLGGSTQDLVRIDRKIQGGQNCSVSGGTMTCH
jgi:hypothetical protein